MSALSFDIFRRSATCSARLGRVNTPHGSFDTPAFMPVGTQGTIKGVLPAMVAELGAQIILANTFHLMLRPGSALVAKMGGADGLHAWMGWRGPILTDSGGFQVFSLADLNQITEAGVVFRSPHDGSRVELSPEISMRVQNELGADVIMAFDDCPPAGGDQGVGCEVSGVGSDEDASGGADARGSDRDFLNEEPEGSQSSPHTRHPTPHTRTLLATERSIRWLERCVAAHGRKQDQALFGIVQGGTDLPLRSWCAQAVQQHDLPGYAIGGVAVGESFEQMKRVVEHTAPLLPTGKPRYLMGVGYERDILMAVKAGIDMFDCVLPTRNGRNANAFTPTGQMRLRNAKYAEDPRPIDETCDCVACGGGKGPRDQGIEGSRGQVTEAWGTDGIALGPSVPRSLGPFRFSRSYLRHLFMAGEMLGPILVTLHNLRHFQRFMLDIRQAIADDDWSGLERRWPVAAGRMKHEE